MANIDNYIRQYGDISFTEKAFCDADAVALCYATYMPFCQVVSAAPDAAPVPFDEAYQTLFELRGSQHKPVGLMLLKNISRVTMDMAKTTRFSEMKILGCTDNYSREPAVQFNAATFLLPNGDVVINFQGTDDTLVGWLEDFDILVKDAIPSQQLAVEYIREIAARFEGDLIVCGHSKGGFTAQYGVLNSEKPIRDRVKWLYNLEGPGFADFSHLNSQAYAEMLPRYKHFVPQASLIGMLMSHDDDYTVIKSSKLLGPTEHELSTWQIDGDALVVCKDLTNSAKVSDLMLYDVVKNMTPAKSEAFGKILETLVDGANQRALLDVKNNMGATLKGIREAWKELDRETKETFREMLPEMRNSLKMAVKAVSNGEYKSIRERLEEE